MNKPNGREVFGFLFYFFLFFLLNGMINEYLINSSAVKLTHIHVFVIVLFLFKNKASLSKYPTSTSQLSCYHKYSNFSHMYSVSLYFRLILFSFHNDDFIPLLRHHFVRTKQTQERFLNIKMFILLYHHVIHT